ncbi:MAG: flagellar biosynthetic protein FliR [Planctomycetaceae bacterium]|nr:flagellar biosynthetic protein FliR [Planctomycetaceae bacterium]
MDTWVLLLPIGLVLARVSGFFAMLPIFGHGMTPMIVRVGIALTVTMFTAIAQPCPASLIASPVHWLQATVWMLQEATLGLALGLGVRLVFTAAQQGGFVIAQQIGFTDAGVIDPVTGEEADPIPQLIELLFILLFLAAGGHLLLIRMVVDSYHWFPPATAPDLGALAGGVLDAGAVMLLLAVKLAAPVLAAFLILASVLAVLARVMPEINILFESYPLRVGAGYMLAIGVVPVLDALLGETAQWMKRAMTA